MGRFQFLAALVLLLAGCDVAEPEASSRNPEPLAAGNLRIGDELPDFELRTIEGETVRLSDYTTGDRYVAVVWHSPACPCAHNCAVVVRDAMSGPEYADVAWVGVASGPETQIDWWRDDLRRQREDGILTYPVGIDADASVLRTYGATRTPTVWLADKDGRIRYWGAPESTLMPGADGYRVLVKDAIDDLKAGREVATPRYDPIGCLIEGI